MNIQFKILTVALLTGLLAAPAFADDLSDDAEGSGPYVALNVGKGAMYPACVSGFANCQSYNQNIYFATYGFQYTPRWALELNYGKGGHIAADNGMGILALVLSGSAVGTLHLGDTLAAFAKVGVSYGDFRGYAPAIYKLNNGGVSPSGAIGLEFNFTPHLSARVEGDFFGSYNVLIGAKKMNIMGATAGLMWRY